MKVSTTLRNKLLIDGGLREVMCGTPGSAEMYLLIYSGTAPATADTNNASTRLCTISAADETDASLTFEASATSGVLAKTSGQTWSGTIASTGTASHFRLVGGVANEAAAITASASNAATSYIIQGTIGTSGADLNLASTTLTENNVQTIEYFVLSFPTD